MTFDEVAALAQGLPEVEERAHFDQPAFRIRDKILVTLRHDESGEPVAVLKPPADEMAALAHADPYTFEIASTGWLVVRLATVDPAELRELLVDTWLRIAPRRLAAQHRDALGR